MTCKRALDFAPMSKGCWMTMDPETLKAPNNISDSGKYNFFFIMVIQKNSILHENPPMKIFLVRALQTKRPLDTHTERRTFKIASPFYFPNFA